MTTSIETALETWLRRGGRRMGQIHIESQWDPPRFSLRHIDDLDTAGALLQNHDRPEMARAIARYDARGEFRPLGYAPNLRTGWILRVSTLRDLRLALDFFYPACLGLWKHHSEKPLSTTSLRETLSRQTGMYRVTQLLSEAGAEETVRAACNQAAGCLRRILWDLAPGKPLDPLPAAKPCPSLAEPGTHELPLLCREACSVLVAACLTQVKKEIGQKA